MTINVKIFLLPMLFYAVLALADDAEIKNVSLVPEQIKDALTDVANEANYAAITTYSAQKKSIEESQELVQWMSFHLDNLKKLRDGFERNNYGKVLVGLPVVFVTIACADAFLPKGQVRGFRGARILNIASLLGWGCVAAGIGTTGLILCGGVYDDIYYHVAKGEQQIERLELLIERANVV